MSSRMTFRLLATVVFVFVAAGLTLAREVTMTYQAKLGEGPELQPGTYQVELIKNQETSEVAFYQEDDLVAQVPVTIVTESEKSNRTEVHYETLDGGRVINQIRVAGWKERLVFREPTPTPVTTD